MSRTSKYFLPLTYTSNTHASQPIAPPSSVTVESNRIRTLSTNGFIPDEEIFSFLSTNDEQKSFDLPNKFHRSTLHVAPTLRLDSGVARQIVSSSRVRRRDLSDVDMEMMADQMNLERDLSCNSHTQRTIGSSIAEKASTRPIPATATNKKATKTPAADTARSKPTAPLIVPTLKPIDYSSAPVLKAISETLGIPIQFRSSKDATTTKPGATAATPSIDLTENTPPDSTPTRQMEQEPEETEDGDIDDDRQTWPVIDDLSHPVSDEMETIYAASKRCVLSRMSRDQRRKYRHEDQARTQRVQAKQPIRRFLTHQERSNSPIEEHRSSPPSSRRLPAEVISIDDSSDATSTCSSSEDDFLPSPPSPPRTRSSNNAAGPAWKSKKNLKKGTRAAIRTKPPEPKHPKQHRTTAGVKRLRKSIPSMSARRSTRSTRDRHSPSGKRRRLNANRIGEDDDTDDVEWQIVESDEETKSDEDGEEEEHEEEVTRNQKKGDGATSSKRVTRQSRKQSMSAPAAPSPKFIDAIHKPSGYFAFHGMHAPRDLIPQAIKIAQLAKQATSQWSLEDPFEFENENDSD